MPTAGVWASAYKRNKGHKGIKRGEKGQYQHPCGPVAL